MASILRREDDGVAEAVRSIVAGDVVRRLVVRTISQQLGKDVDGVTAHAKA